MKKIKFTIAALKKLECPPDKSQLLAYDTEQSGLALRVLPSGSKSFLVYKRIKGRSSPVKVTLGKFADLKIEQARSQAKKILAKLVDRVNPNEELRKYKIETKTLQDVFGDYMLDRQHQLSVNTKSSYKTIVEKQFSAWKDKPLSSITRDKVAKRHTEMTLISPTSANKAMRVLRALFNFANGRYEDDEGNSVFPNNPVDRITHTRTWNKESRRQNIIRPTDLGTWFKSVLELGASPEPFRQTASDYLQFILLTGLRRREAAGLRVQDVDFKASIFTVKQTKNGVSLTLPIVPYVEEILNRRCLLASSEFVFPSTTGGALNEPKTVVQKVRDDSGIYFTIHDMRRTFITIAESLDVPTYAIKALVNHSIGADVTAGYIIMDTERLRKPLETITSFILKKADLTFASKVIST